MSSRNSIFSLHKVKGLDYYARPRQSNEWNEVELKRLYEVYPSAFAEELTRLLPGHTLSAIKQKAQKEGLQHGPRRVSFSRSYDDIADGNYVSGLTDGEGCFLASLKQRRGLWNINPKFAIGLRLDDSAILRWLQTYFGCGRYSWTMRNRPNPTGVFVVANLYDIMRCVIPHFEAFPLRRKKLHDYQVWKEMIAVQAESYRKPWSQLIRSRMQELHAELLKTRQFKRRKAAKNREIALAANPPARQRLQQHVSVGNRLKGT